jgi:alkyl hydroperoxide reductase subunit AhpC
VLRAMVYYPMSNGRSIDEFVRLVKALQTSDAHKVATPENWQPGDKVLSAGIQRSNVGCPLHVAIFGKGSET